MQVGGVENNEDALKKFSVKAKCISCLEKIDDALSDLNVKDYVDCL